jgi:serine/threonine protein kinase/tetratricopeptide (TPR) repeat protein
MKSADHSEEVLFREARQRPKGPEREAYLDHACAGNEALRNRLAALLQADESPDPFLEPQVSGLLGQMTTRPAPDSKVEEAGARIGHYKLLEKIGEGGCGVVYMAEQEEPIRRRVAFKVIKLGMDTKQVIARFESERQALALMDHPNIAKVHDAGATDTGRPYFVMELVRGIKITEYCDQNNLSTEERLSLFVQVCHAIQHAHQKGIIHRDIKPSNILVTLHDGVPVPKVIDFGIAKATTGQRLTDKTLFTAFQQFIGTPAYMSPEQAEMSGLDIDTRSDIYALGVLLYELLTGQTPFEQKALVAAGLDEMRRIIREQEPVRPSTRLSTLADPERTTVAKRRGADPPQLIHLLRGDLDWIVMKAIEKDRTRRYETANGVADDILRHLSNEPVAARPPNRLYRLQKLVRRNKLVFVAAALIAAVLVAATGVSVWQAVRATRAETLAKQRLAESEAISKFLTEVFQSPDPERDGRTITVAETLGAAAKKLETDLANQPARRASLQATLGETYWGLGLYGEAIAMQEKVRDYYLATFGPEHPDTLNAMEDLAGSYTHAGRHDEALKLREQVLPLSRKALGPEHTVTVRAMASLADSYRDAGRYEEALKLQEQVLALRRKVLGPEHHHTIFAMRDLSDFYYNAGRRDESLKLKEEEVALRRKVSGLENTYTLWDMGDLASLYDQAGRREEALKLREQVLALRRKVSGPEHPETLWAMFALANSYDQAGRREEALKLREDLLVLRRKVFGPEHPDTLWAMHHLAHSYDEAGRWDEARKLREEALALRRKVFGPAHPDTLNALDDIAHTLATSDVSEIRNGTNAVRLAEEAVAATSRTNASFLDTLAAAYAETHQFDKAVRTQNDAIAVLRNEAEKSDYKSRLKLYEDKTPYRQPTNNPAR